MLSIIKRRLTFANVVSLIAIFLALGGGMAVALSRNQVKSRHIAKNAVKSKQLAPNAVRSKQIKNGQVRSKDIKNGAIRDVDLAKRYQLGTGTDGGTGGESVANGASESVRTPGGTIVFTCAAQPGFGYADAGGGGGPLVIRANGTAAKLGDGGSDPRISAGSSGGRVVGQATIVDGGGTTTVQMAATREPSGVCHFGVTFQQTAG